MVNGKWRTGKGTSHLALYSTKPASEAGFVLYNRRQDPLLFRAAADVNLQVASSDRDRIDRCRIAVEIDQQQGSRTTIEDVEEVPVHIRSILRAGAARFVPVLRAA